MIGGNCRGRLLGMLNVCSSSSFFPFLLLSYLAIHGWIGIGIGMEAGLGKNMSKEKAKSKTGPDTQPLPTPEQLRQHISDQPDSSSSGNLGDLDEPADYFPTVVEPVPIKTNGENVCVREVSAGDSPVAIAVLEVSFYLLVCGHVRVISSFLLALGVVQWTRC